MIVYLSLLVAIAGVIVYLAAKPDNPKVMELGRIAYAFGLLVFLLVVVGGKIVNGNGRT